MKSTGIVRNLDSLGRIVIPMELRRTLNISQNDAIEIYTDGERIVLQSTGQAAAFAARRNRA